MTTSSILRSAWKALEDEHEHLAGLYERRVFAGSGFALFAGLVRPAMSLRFTVGVPPSVGTDGLERETKGFRVQRQYVAAERMTQVSLELGRPVFRELFEVMADDIAASVLAARDEAAAVAAMRERLNHWERFMTVAGPEGLSREKQIGLYGELTALKTLLLSGVPAADAVAWWLGPIRESQDFQAGKCALEVKTTTANSPTSVRISNELQLDDTDCEPLYLLLLWLKERENAGQTLPELVDEIAALVAETAASAFEDRLAAAGYHEVQRELYGSTGYAERQRRYYAVRDELPRIRRPDLRAGVSNVEYRIELSGFDSYVRDENTVIEALSGSAE